MRKIMLVFYLLGRWLRVYGPYLLLLAALWGWRETWLEKQHEGKVAAILLDEQEMRLSIMDGALTAHVRDKFARRDALVTALRTWRKENGK